MRQKKDNRQKKNRCEDEEEVDENTVNDKDSTNQEARGIDEPITLLFFVCPGFGFRLILGEK